MLALAKPRGQYIRWKGGAWRAPASFRPAVPKQRISMPLVHLHSLWVGPRLNYLERLCLAAATAMGHDFPLWSYEPGALAGVPAESGRAAVRDRVGQNGEHMVVGDYLTTQTHT